MLITLNEKPKIQNYYNYMENCLETKQTKPRLEERKNWLLIAIYKLFAIFAAQVSMYKIEQGLNAYSTGVFFKKINSRVNVSAHICLLVICPAFPLMTVAHRIL